MTQISMFQASPTNLEDAFLTIFENDLARAQLTDQIHNSQNFSPTLQASSNEVADQDCLIDKINDNEIDSRSNPSIKRKLFTKEEDRLLTTAALAFNQESWNKIAKFVPGKTPKQCRDRWVNYLQPFLNFKPWTNEEDQLLVSLVNTQGKHWAKMMNNFPNRSANSIKNRWYWLVKNHINVIPMENVVNTRQNILLFDQNSFATGINQSFNNQNYKSIFIGNAFGDNNKNQIGINNLNESKANSSTKKNQTTNNYYYYLRSKPINIKSSKKSQNKNKNNDNKSQKLATNNSIKNNNNNCYIESNQIFDDDILMLNIDEFEW